VSASALRFTAEGLPSTGLDFAELILEKNVPLELCMTSNVICKTVTSYEDHHIRDFFPDHPCSLCTDDMGIFGSTLSQEYAIAAQTFNMDKRQLFDLSRNSIDSIFAGEAVKEKLREEWDRFWRDQAGAS
jgi:adenosine deaminase